MQFQVAVVNIGYKAAEMGGVQNFYAEINPDFFDSSIKFLLNM
jgi:hypothetical protein